MARTKRGRPGGSAPEDADAAADSAGGESAPAASSKRQKWIPKYELQLGLRPVQDASGEVTQAWCKFCETLGRENAAPDETEQSGRKRRKPRTNAKVFKSFRRDNIMLHLVSQHPLKWAEFRRLPERDARRLSFFPGLPEFPTNGQFEEEQETAFRAELGAPEAASMSEFEDMATSAPTPISTVTEPHAVTIETEAPALAPAVSWATNLERRGGFWGNAFWYDLQLERRMPQARPMLDELVMALPPCNGKMVLDLCAGSGRASAAVLAAYPTAQFVLLDSSAQRLEMAAQRLDAVKAGVSRTTQFLAKTVDAGDARLTEGSVDVVIACLAFHVIAEKPAHYARSPTVAAPVSKEQVYEQLFRAVWQTLRPGGHLVFADHVGQLPLFKQLQALERAGFEHVDCAWRKEDSFVAGGRKPVGLTA